MNRRMKRDARIDIGDILCLIFACFLFGSIGWLAFVYKPTPEVEKIYYCTHCYNGFTIHQLLRDNTGWGGTAYICPVDNANGLRIVVRTD